MPMRMPNVSDPPSRGRGKVTAQRRGFDGAALLVVLMAVGLAGLEWPLLYALFRVGHGSDFWVLLGLAALPVVAWVGVAAASRRWLGKGRRRRPAYLRVVPRPARPPASASSSLLPE